MGLAIEYPSSITLGGHLRYSPAENLELGLQVYNLTDKFDLRGNGGLADASNNPTVIGGSPVIGRTVMASVKVSF